MSFWYGACDGACDKTILPAKGAQNGKAYWPAKADMSLSLKGVAREGELERRMARQLA